MATYTISDQKTIGDNGLVVKVCGNVTVKCPGKPDMTFYHEIEDAGRPLSNEFVADALQSLADSIESKETGVQPPTPVFVTESDVI